MSPARTRIDIHVFDGWDELDALGPYEILAGTPELDVALVVLDGPRAVTAAHGLVVQASAPRARPDVVVVPGGGWDAPSGPGTREEVRRGPLVDAVARHHAGGAIVASVCTGAHVLAAAGLLRGRRATTHHASWADLEAAGAILAAGDRVVDTGDVVTSGGVTSGLHLGLHLVERLVSAEARRMRDDEMEVSGIPGAPAADGGRARD